MAASIDRSMCPSAERLGPARGNIAGRGTTGFENLMPETVSLDDREAAKGEPTPGDGLPAPIPPPRRISPPFNNTRFVHGATVP